MRNRWEDRENIAITSTDMTALHAAKLPMSSFGLLALSFSQNILDRAGTERMQLPLFSLDYLKEEQQEAETVAPVLKLDMSFLLQQIRKVEEIRRTELLRQAPPVTKTPAQTQQSPVTETKKQSSAAPSKQTIPTAAHAQTAPTQPVVPGGDTIHIHPLQTQEKILLQQTEKTLLHMERIVERAARMQEERKAPHRREPRVIAPVQPTAEVSGQSGAAERIRSVADAPRGEALPAAVVNHIRSGDDITVLQPRSHTHVDGDTTVWNPVIHQHDGDITVYRQENTHVDGDTAVIQQSSSHHDGDMTVTHRSHTRLGDDITVLQPRSHTHVDGDTTVWNQVTHQHDGDITVYRQENTHVDGDTTVVSENHIHRGGDITAVQQNSTHVDGDTTMIQQSSSHRDGDMTVTHRSHTRLGDDITVLQPRSHTHVDGDTTVWDQVTHQHDGDITVYRQENTHVDGDTTVVSENHIRRGGDTTVVQQNEFRRDGDTIQNHADSGDTIRVENRISHQTTVQRQGDIRRSHFSNTTVEQNSLWQQEITQRNSQEVTYQEGNRQELTFLQESAAEPETVPDLRPVTDRVLEKAVERLVAAGAGEAPLRGEQPMTYRQVQRIVERTVSPYAGQKSGADSRPGTMFQANTRPVVISDTPHNAAGTESAVYTEGSLRSKSSGRPSHRPVTRWQGVAGDQSKPAAPARAEMLFSRILQAEREQGLTYGATREGVPSGPRERSAFLKETTQLLSRRETLLETVQAFTTVVMPQQELAFLAESIAALPLTQEAVTKAEQVVHRVVNRRRTTEMKTTEDTQEFLTELRHLTSEKILRRVGETTEEQEEILRTLTEEGRCTTVTSYTPAAQALEYIQVLETALDHTETLRSEQRQQTAHHFRRHRVTEWVPERWDRTEQETRYRDSTHRHVIHTTHTTYQKEQTVSEVLREDDRAEQPIAMTYVPATAAEQLEPPVPASAMPEAWREDRIRDQGGTFRPVEQISYREEPRSAPQPSAASRQETHREYTAPEDEEVPVQEVITERPQVTWENPLYNSEKPALPPQELTAKKTGTASGSPAAHISQQEINRAADQVYQAIEQRLRTERRRRGM